MNRNVRWLYLQLPELVKKGVLSAGNVEQLHSYYDDLGTRNKQRIAMTAFSLLGAFLIGLGMILLLAHNWTELSRPVRTILSLVPVILAQILTGWTLSKHSESVAWREGVSTFFILAIGASISLIAQTYHMPSDMSAFLLTWMLLSIPLVYVLRATAPAALYLIGITSWACYAQNEGGHAIIFWPLASLIIPHFLQAVRKNLYGNRSIILCWVISLCLCVATGIVMEKVLPGLWIITYTGLLAFLCLTGILYFSEGSRNTQPPFYKVGAAGIFFLSLMLTFEWPWEEIGWRYYRPGGRFYEYAAIPEYLLIAFLLIACSVLISTALKRRNVLAILFGAAPILAVIGYSCSAFRVNTIFPAMLFNLYLLVLGLGIMIMGIRSAHMGTVNMGMIIVMALIGVRFFDSNLGFIARGLVFIILGSGFLSTNIMLKRRWRAVQ